MTNKTTTKAAPVEATATQSELATIVEPSLPMSVEAKASAVKQWHAYEELLTLPFVPKESCAQEQPWFSIVAIGERESQSLTDPQLVIDQWILLAQFEEPCALRTRAGEVRSFERGDKALVTINKGSVQDRTITVLSNIIGAHGCVPHMTLRQLAPKKAGHNGAIVLTAASSE